METNCRYVQLEGPRTRSRARVLVDKLTNSHDRVTKHSQACLNTGIEPPWVTKGRTLLIMKNIKKGGVAGSYIPIACLTIMWKFLTEINADEI